MDKDYDDWPPLATDRDRDRDPTNPFRRAGRKHRMAATGADVEDECQCDELPDEIPCATCYIAGVKEWPEGDE